jgi:hypothetical protein
MDWQIQFGAKSSPTFSIDPYCQGTGEQAPERAGAGAAMVVGIGAGVFTGFEDARKLAPVFTAVT